MIARLTALALLCGATLGPVAAPAAAAPTPRGGIGPAYGPIVIHAHHHTHAHAARAHRHRHG